MFLPLHIFVLFPSPLPPCLRIYFRQSFDWQFEGSYLLTDDDGDEVGKGNKSIIYAKFYIVTTWS